MQNYNKSHEEGFLKNKKSYINVFTTAPVSEKVNCVDNDYQINAIWYLFEIINSMMEE